MFLLIISLTSLTASFVVFISPSIFIALLQPTLYPILPYDFFFVLTYYIPYWKLISTLLSCKRQIISVLLLN